MSLANIIKQIEADPSIVDDLLTELDELPEMDDDLERAFRQLSDQRAKPIRTSGASVM